MNLLPFPDSRRFLLPLFLLWVGHARVGAASALLTGDPAFRSTTALGASVDPVLSADGRVAAFVSAAPNLVEGDANGSILDVFVSRLVEATCELASVGVGGKAGNGRSHSPALSADGRWLAFVSEASDLVPGDTNGVSDVFVRDLEEGRTWLVSVASSGTGPGSGASDRPGITPDGRFVAFESWAADLVDGDTGGQRQVFLRDLPRGVTHWISRPSTQPAPPPAQPPTRASDPVVSRDGTKVAFLATGGLLAPAPRGNRSPLYLRDLVTGSLRMVDLLPAGVSNSTVSVAANPAWTPEGRWLVVHLDLPAGAGVSGLYRIDLEAGAVEPVAPSLDTRRPPADPVGSTGASLSEDGATVVFEGCPLVGANRAMPAVYAVVAGQEPVLLSTNLAWASQPARALPAGRLLAASSTSEFVAFAAPDPLPEGSTQNGPVRLWMVHRPTGEVRRVGGVPAETGASDDFLAASLDGGGRRLVFHSADPGWVGEDRNSAPDVFLYDWDSGRLQCLSLGRETRASSTAVGRGLVSLPSVSGDGRWLAMTRRGAWRGNLEVVLRDLADGGTLEVAGGNEAGAAWDPSLSVDGRWVAFTSSGTNLATPGPGAGMAHVYLRDRVGGETVWVSAPAAGGTSAPAAVSEQARVSPEGRFVAFTSTAALVAEDRTASSDVYLWDRQTSGLRLLTRSVLGGAANRASDNPGWSPEGRWLTFQSLASDLTTNLVAPGSGRWFAWDSFSDALLLLGPLEPNSLPTKSPGLTDPGVGVVFGRDGLTLALREGSAGSAVLVRRIDGSGFAHKVPGARDPHLDPGGRLLAYRDALAGSPTLGQILVFHLDTLTTSLGSVGASGEPSNAGGTQPALSADGRLLFFVSASTNLLPEPYFGPAQLYARDLVAGRTLRVSVGPGGEAANAPVTFSKVLPDGRSVVFATAASNLDPEDCNEATDLFLVRVEPGDARPLLSITRPATDRVTLVWAASETGSDRVEYQTELGSPVWTRLEVPVVVDRGQAQAVDGSAPGLPRRFYRVVRE